MSQKNKPSTIAWMITHLGYPLLPVLIEAGIRLIVFDWEIRIDTMSAATLAMSVGLVALFVNQSIRADSGTLGDQVETDTRNGTCTFFTGIGIIFFILFGLIVLLQAVVAEKDMVNLRSTLQGFQHVVFFFAAVPIFSAVAAQRTYKLRAEIV